MARVSPKMAIASVLSVAVYLGLAILGWGGITPFFASPARCVLARGSQVGRCGLHRSAREGPRDIICPGGGWIVSRRAGSGAFPNRRWVTSANEIANNVLSSNC